MDGTESTTEADHVGTTPTAQETAVTTRVRTPLRLSSWAQGPVLAAAGLAAASGFAQFGVAATLADVAAEFGTPVGGGTSVLAQVGLSGVTIGIGLAVIRLASVASLPLVGLADTLGRRRMLLTCVAAGLALTATAATSQGFWWFVILLAAARPMLSATNALVGLIAAEETGKGSRSAAVALVTAAYGIGAGLIALIRSLFGDVLGFRGVFLLVLIPLALLPLLARWLREPERFERMRSTPAGRAELRIPVLGPLLHRTAGRLGILAVLMLMVSFSTGPTNTLLFLYIEGVLGRSPAVSAALVIAAAPTGLLGLVVGRWTADRFGRRGTTGVALALIATGGALAYSGGLTATATGYLLTLTAGAAFATSFGAQAAELFPTSVRGSVAGWLAAIGVIGATGGLLTAGILADRLGGFGPAALVIAVPVFASSLLVAVLPETRGQELEESAPER